ncbi:MAG: hypothetical protein BJ554DRAFT_5570, partial [Olpidium bornovanus]
RLVPGCSGVSYGSVCATLAGIPASVVERGRECSQLLARYIPPMPLFEDSEDDSSTREGAPAMRGARAACRPYRDPFVMCDKIVKRFMTMDISVNLLEKVTVPGAPEVLLADREGLHVGHGNLGTGVHQSAHGAPRARDKHVQLAGTITPRLTFRPPTAVHGNQTVAVAPRTASTGQLLGVLHLHRGPWGVQAGLCPASCAVAFPSFAIPSASVPLAFPRQLGGLLISLTRTRFSFALMLRPQAGRETPFSSTATSRPAPVFAVVAASCFIGLTSGQPVADLCGHFYHRPTVITHHAVFFSLSSATALATPVNGGPGLCRRFDLEFILLGSARAELLGPQDVVAIFAMSAGSSARLPRPLFDRFET